MHGRVLSSLPLPVASSILFAILLVWGTSAHGGGAIPPLSEDLDTLQKAGISPEPKVLQEELRKRAGSTEAVNLTTAIIRTLANRPVDGTLATLMECTDRFKDASVREEAVTVIARLGVQKGKADPLLLDALKGGGEQQKAAIHALARRSTVEHRALLRPLLEDRDAKVRDFTATCLRGRNPYQSAEADDHQTKTDEGLLRDFKVAPEEKGLLEFFRQRTVTPNDEQQIRGWVRDLGASTHRVREQASRQLFLKGPPAVKFLETAMEDPDQEVAQRARLCLERIAQGAGSALPIAAVRLLPGRVPPNVATKVLLDYVPFADDLQIEDEVLHSLYLLTFRSAKLDPQLTVALGDGHALRRGAAAAVLGKAGLKEDCQAVAKLLRDDDPRVRLRAGQGLLAARDPQAVPELISLLETIPQNRLHAIEEPLFSLAGEQTPSLPADFKGDPRKKQVEIWQAWWGKEGKAIDLASLSDEERRLGLYIVSEYDSIRGRGTGRIFEMTRDGKQRWELSNLQGPMSVQYLPGNRVLIAENMAMKITERDLKGTTHWEHKCQTYPIQATRLPGGNTFIATYHELYELAPGGKQVYKHDFGRNQYIFSAQRLRDGRIVYLTSMGVLKEIEAVSGKEVNSINLNHNGWGSVEALPGGRYLVALQNPGVVREIDGSGKTLWSLNFPGVFRASRLPGGNVTVASMNNRKVAEYDRNQQLRWEKTCDGRPWCVLYR